MSRLSPDSYDAKTLAESDNSQKHVHAQKKTISYVDLLDIITSMTLHKKTIQRQSGADAHFPENND
jgi:hypothetical protein